MKILYITPNSPLPLDAGGRYRANSLFKVFIKMGDLGLILVDDYPPEDAIITLGNSVLLHLPSRRENKLQKVWRYIYGILTRKSIIAMRYLGRCEAKKIIDMVEEFNPDVIVLGDTYLSVLLPRLKSFMRPLIVDTHNIESLLNLRLAGTTRGVLQKLRFLIRYLNAMTIERRLLVRASQVWATSDVDARYYQDVLQLNNVEVIPNAIDIARYADYQNQSGEEDGAVVFTGWFAYEPNEDAALKLISMSRQLREDGVPHTLYLVGRNPTNRMYRAARGEPQIVITGEVPDTRPYLARAAIFAAPLIAGSGTKLKILEALALSRPVLTTPIGAEGLDLHDGKHAFIRGIDEFYLTLRWLLEKPDERYKIARSGHEWLRKHFTIDVIFTKVENALKEVSLQVGKSVSR